MSQSHGDFRRHCFCNSLQYENVPVHDSLQSEPEATGMIIPTWRHKKRSWPIKGCVPLWADECSSVESAVFNMQKDLPVVPARGGAEVALLRDILYKIFFIYRICMRRAPARPVRALCEAVAQMLSKNMTCARPRHHAMPSKYFPHTSHCTLHTSHLHFTPHTSSHLKSCELFSPHLSSSHLIPSPLRVI